MAEDPGETVNKEQPNVMSGGPGSRMPVMFVGHGNPMNAITDNDFAPGWESMIDGVPRPRAVLCVSAHWDTRGVRVMTNPRPATIHDFWGFPRELYEVDYPCPGSPEWSGNTVTALKKVPVREDHDRGLDHGTWAVVKWMYPDADVPVFQVSLDTSRPASFHYDLGRWLAPLRDRGVLILGSGNMVHNLAMMEMTEGSRPYDWALEFDDLLLGLIRGREHEKLVDYNGLGPAARLAIPTPEHYLPLVTVLGASRMDEPLVFYNNSIDVRSVSMTSVKVGG